MNYEDNKCHPQSMALITHTGLCISFQKKRTNVIREDLHKTIASGAVVDDATGSSSVIGGDRPLEDPYGDTVATSATALQERSRPTVGDMANAQETADSLWTSTKERHTSFKREKRWAKRNEEDSPEKIKVKMRTVLGHINLARLD